MLSYHSCHIFGTWREIGGRFFFIFGEIGWGGFLNHHMRGKPQRVGTIFYGRVEPSRHQVKIFIWQLEESQVE